ncbi:6-phospho-beta-glucosidase [compost metagenome]
MKKEIKVVTIGGGSSYTPELVEGFIKRYHEMPLSELWLVDVVEGADKLQIIFDLCQRMIKKAGVPIKLYQTLDRRVALQNADFVTTQFRVGQLDARAKDERIPLSHGVIGQETNGAGGLFKALRTIPVIFTIIKDIEELCPNAWMINFTNPAGLITEAVYRHTNFRRFIGVCNVPVGMKMFANDLLKVEDAMSSMKLFGLNHMVFMQDFVVNGQSRMDELLTAITQESNQQSVSVKNISDLPFDMDLINGLKLIPCPYLRYYYKEKEMLAILLGEYHQGKTRAEVVKKVEEELFALYKDPALDVKPKQLEERGGAYYSDAACDVINAIVNDKMSEHYVNVPNNGHVKNIPHTWCIEISCTIGKEGVIPHPEITEFDENVLGLISAIKSYEIATSKAALTGNYRDLIVALNMNPLIHSDDDAKMIANDMLLAHQKHLPQFDKAIQNIV